jgi:hypothetical protein
MAHYDHPESEQKAKEVEVEQLPGDGDFQTYQDVLKEDRIRPMVPVEVKPVQPVTV